MIQFITPNIQTVQKVQIPRNYCNKWTVLVLGSGLDLIRRDITQTKSSYQNRGTRENLILATNMEPKKWGDSKKCRKHE